MEEVAVLERLDTLLTDKAIESGIAIDGRVIRSISYIIYSIVHTYSPNLLNDPPHEGDAFTAIVGKLNSNIDNLKPLLAIVNPGSADALPQIVIDVTNDVINKMSQTNARRTTNGNNRQGNTLSWKMVLNRIIPECIDKICTPSETPQTGNSTPAGQETHTTGSAATTTQQTQQGNAVQPTTAGRDQHLDDLYLWLASAIPSEYLQTQFDPISSAIAAIYNNDNDNIPEWVLKQLVPRYHRVFTNTPLEKSLCNTVIKQLVDQYRKYIQDQQPTAQSQAPQAPKANKARDTYLVSLYAIIDEFKIDDKQATEARSIIDKISIHTECPKEILLNDRTTPIIIEDNDQALFSNVFCRTAGVKSYKEAAIEKLLTKYTTKKGVYKAIDGKSGIKDPLSGNMKRLYSPDNSISDDILMPASGRIDSSTILWDQAVIQEFGSDIPVLNIGSPEIQTMLDKDASFMARGTAMTSIRKQMDKATLGYTQMVSILQDLKRFTTEKTVPVVLNPLLIAATDKYINAVEGDEIFKVISMPANGKYTPQEMDLNLGFLSLFYNVLAPTSGAKVYVSRSQAFASDLKTKLEINDPEYSDIKALKADLEENPHHPKFFILTPAKARFHKAAIESYVTQFLGVFREKSSRRLVKADMDGHECILVLKPELAKGLFNIY